MLYRTTRSKYDVVTAHKTVCTDCYADGGLYLPFRMPQFDSERLEELLRATQPQIVADVLNMLFGTQLSAAQTQDAIGSKAVRCVTVGRRVLSAEFWHNSDADIEGFVRALGARLGTQGTPSNWVRIAVRIALLFAAFSSAQTDRTQKTDLAMATGDFSMPIAAWYARQMGLPVGNILCGCNANGAFWELINHGELPSGERAIATLTPDADLVVPRDLERLIHGVFGVEETQRYLRDCAAGAQYALSEEQTHLLSQGLFSAVISDRRIESIIPGVYRTRAQILGPYSALAYGCLQDFRATTGMENRTVLLAERGVQCDAALVARCLKIRQPQLEKRRKR